MLADMTRGKNLGISTSVVSTLVSSGDDKPRKSARIQGSSRRMIGSSNLNLNEIEKVYGVESQPFAKLRSSQRKDYSASRTPAPMSKAKAHLTTTNLDGKRSVGNLIVGGRAAGATDYFASSSVSMPKSRRQVINPTMPGQQSRLERHQAGLN